MKHISNESLHDLVKAEIKSIRAHYRARIKAVREGAMKLDVTLAKLSHLELDWFGTETIYIRLEAAGKAEFSDHVRAIAQALNESPDIRLGEGHSEYMADFKDNMVHVYMRDPKDCKLIETEVTVTRKVLKPHPACKAALAVLEEVS